MLRVIDSSICGIIGKQTILQGTFNLDKTGFNQMMPGHINNHEIILMHQQNKVGDGRVDNNNKLQ